MAGLPINETNTQSDIEDIAPNSLLPSTTMTRKEAIAIADEKLLAELGYKQEFKRAFTPLEVIRSFLAVLTD
ncbi:hypothetical protein JVT61DRAFT_4651 [Boletus reticuloceps]|uniref:Uncharacterized protein n=1 Tax=Boletus reticuloceps TaxID=495285 RepID=A0A8I3A8Y8_9AGAM|nr:hypothetical protein JVT61DRAFT_4651 [Boletus reticuloceps]